MTSDNDTPDLSGLVSPAPVPTVEKARELLLTKIMAGQQALSEQFSKIDHPFATGDARDDHELARDEFQALIRCSVHLPESVEGVRFLEAWHKNRLDQVSLLLEHAQPGNKLVLGKGADPMPITAEFAAGMRAALMVVQSMFRDFPLALTTTLNDEEEPGL